MRLIKVVQLQVEAFESRIERIERDKYLDRNGKFRDVCMDFSLAISSIAERHPALTLNDIKPITEAFDNYKDTYFKR